MGRHGSGLDAQGSDRALRRPFFLFGRREEMVGNWFQRAMERAGLRSAADADVEPRRAAGAMHGDNLRVYFFLCFTG